MGWKNIQQAFEIKRHIVTAYPGGVAIGTASIPNLIQIDGQSGTVMPHEFWPMFAENQYPAIQAAGAQELRELISTPDHFDIFIPVYTFEHGKIIQRFCEKPGYPNVTHDGHLMHENLYSTEYDLVLQYAQRIINLEVKCAKSQVEKLEDELGKWRDKLTEVTGLEKSLGSEQRS